MAAPRRRNDIPHRPEFRVQRQRIRLAIGRAQTGKKRNHTAPVDGGSGQSGLQGDTFFQKITR